MRLEMNIGVTSQLTDHVLASSLPSIYEERKEWTADGKLIQRPNRREEWKCDKSAKKAWKHEERLKKSEKEWRRRGMNREISQESRRRRDKDVWSESWRHTQAGERASERARRERQEGGGQFIWSFIRGSETEERETGSRTKAIRGFSGEDMCGQKSISPPSVSTQHTQYQQHR